MAKLSNREKAEIVDSLSGQHDLDLLLKIIGERHIKKSCGPERLAKLSNREKAEIVDSLSGQHDLDLLLKIIGLPRSKKAEIVDYLSGQHDLDLLLNIIGLPRSSYYYARKHPKAATRPDVHEKVKEIFNRTANGCGHRQILMRLRRLPRSSYYYARKHPKAATRPDVHEKVKEIFNRTANGCGHRQILMRLRREFNITISRKTVLKVMRELGLVCKIRRKGFRKYSSFKGVTSTVPNLIARDFKAEAPTISRKTVLKVMRELGLVCKIRRKGFRKYSSFKGVTSTVPNLIARDFTAEAPFTKIGTDVTEFALSFCKVYLAQVVAFHSNEILAYSLSHSPNMLHQKEMFDAMVKVLPPGACPILHSDMGWQYQNPAWIGWLPCSGC